MKHHLSTVSKLYRKTTFKPDTTYLLKILCVKKPGLIFKIGFFIKENVNYL